MKKTKIYRKPCPFCGTADTHPLCFVFVHGESGYSVACTRCGTCGPTAKTIEKAAKRWDERKTTSA